VRIAAQLVDLKMPGALKTLDGVLAGVDGGQTTATAALLDRLLHRYHIVNIPGNSCRMRRSDPPRSSLALSSGVAPNRAASCAPKPATSRALEHRLLGLLTSIPNCWLVQSASETPHRLTDIPHTSIFARRGSTMSAPSATTNPRRRKLAATILAFFALQFAFVTVGDAVSLEAEFDATPTVTSEPTNPVDAVPAGVPTASSDGAEMVGEGDSAPVASAVAQRPPHVVPFYDHPFVPDECFWYCMERKCPCERVFP